MCLGHSHLTESEVKTSCCKIIACNNERHNHIFDIFTLESKYVFQVMYKPLSADSFSNTILEIYGKEIRTEMVFECLILVSIDFNDFTSPFSP